MDPNTEMARTNAESCTKAPFCVKKLTTRCVLSLALGLLVFTSLAYGLATFLRDGDSAAAPAYQAVSAFPGSSDELRQAAADLMQDSAFAQSLSEIAPAAGTPKAPASKTKDSAKK